MRTAILEAAVKTIAEQGLSASTATIARQAGVAHGSLFNHFASKSALLDAVYIQLKAELNQVALEGLPDTADAKARLHHLWTRWVDWGTSKPARRRALAQLNVPDRISEASRAASMERSAMGIEIVRRASADGALKDQSIEFVGSIFEALAGATMDFMIRDPRNAEAYRDAVFDTLWKGLQ